VARIARLLRRQDAAVVHTHRYRENTLGALACGLLPRRRPRQVVTVHGLPEPYRGWRRLKMGLYRALETAALRAGRPTLIAVSRQMQFALQDRYPTCDTVYLPNGIDPARLKPVRDPSLVRWDLKLSRRAPVIAMIGRLAPVKGADLFLWAAHRMLRARPELRFLVIGEGPERGALEALARELGLEGGVRFLGHRDDLPDLLQIVDVVLMPSRHEGMPLSLLEALALGKPVVAAAVGGIPEVLRDQEQGVLVPPENPLLLADAALALLAQPARARELGAQARQRVLRDFSHTRLAENVAALYHRVAA
jgi:glycosyltransferase involved in cell wall biosynthesis